MQRGREGLKSREGRGSDGRQSLLAVSHLAAVIQHATDTSLAAKHAASGVIHPHMSAACTHPVTASQRARRREGRDRLFTYGKVTNSLQALC